MVFFAQKILRTVPGNWTFVIVTDRVELDDQIAKTFKACFGDLTSKRGHMSVGFNLGAVLQMALIDKEISSVGALLHLRLIRKRLSKPSHSHFLSPFFCFDY